MENFAQLAPLMILIPAVGAIINFFWGARMGEKAAAIVGITASSLTFVVALLLLSYLTANDYTAAVINPPLLESWIRIDSAGVDISWQTRVDTLSVTMMLFITFVGTLIHIYSVGYMHSDPRFARFFAYLNMFLAFMLILVTGNNFLMMFVGWEGVGLCSYLLIGFWWDKAQGVGWKNGNAARKAFIVNRIGDFGVLMAMFLIFWTFGTLDFYKPGEIANPDAGAAHVEEGQAEDEGHEEAAAPESGDEAAEDHGETAAASQEGEHSAEGEESAHAEDDAHGSSGPVAVVSFETEGVELHQLGVFGQAEYRFAQQEASGTEDEVEFGPFSLSLESMVVLITLFLLLGATGKSAQIPLLVWLPDAMAGPTPVSALIHAATMVTSGVYMMVRANTLFHHAELTSFVVTIIGAATALSAGFIAVAQFDIKRVLAYSTISQLGFMVAAVGVGAYPAAMFHLVTHAFFKGLLFLGSGSVIHGMEHGHHLLAHGHDRSPDLDEAQLHSEAVSSAIEVDKDHEPDIVHAEEEFDPQDMRNMGGLRRRMPVTYWTYVIGTLALAGIWPFAGFWSKDEILADSWLVGINDGKLQGFIALGLLLLAAGFTAFYMWRQVEMIFHGHARHEAAEHAHESPPTMIFPLIILAFFSVFVGFINIPSGLSSLFVFGLDGTIGRHVLGDFLTQSVVHAHLPPFQPVIAIAALGLGLFAIFTARSIYGGGKAIDAQRKDPLQVNPGFAASFRLANARLYWDEIYFRLFENPYNRLANLFANIIDWQFWHDYVHNSVILRGFNGIAKLLGRPFDLGIVDGAVNGLARLVRWASGRMRRVQTGYVRTYVVALFFGVIVVIVIMLLPLINMN